MPTSTESIVWTSAANTAQTIGGGRYLFAATSSNFGGGSVALQGQLPDGTFATVPDIAGSAISLTANGWKTVDLAPGQYKLLITTATGVIASATRVPS